MDRVKLTEKDIKKYLDSCIIFWRKKRDTTKDMHEETAAVCYIDAYQSVRTSLFNELLEWGELKCHTET